MDVWPSVSVDGMLRSRGARVDHVHAEGAGGVIYDEDGEPNGAVSRWGRMWSWRTEGKMFLPFLAPTHEYRLLSLRQAKQQYDCMNSALKP